MRLKEHLLPLFDNTDSSLHHLVIQHCLFPWVHHLHTHIGKDGTPLGVLMGLLKSKCVDFDGQEVPDVRPIVTGHAPGRLVGSLLLGTISGQLATWFQESVLNARQFAVGVKDGTAKAVHAVRLLLEAGLTGHDDPDDPGVVISTDISNAYNEISRDAIFQILLDTADEDGPWMDDLPEGVELPVPAVLRKYFTHFIVKYHTTTTVRYFRPNGTYIDVDCAGGVHQGCPFGTTLFCAALHVSLSLVMAQHPDVEAVAYADNIYLVAPLTKAHAAFDDLTASLAKNLSLSVSTSQSYIYIPSTSQDDWDSKRAKYDAFKLHRSLSGKDTLPLMEDGFTCLGTHIGSDDFRRTHTLCQIGDRNSEAFGTHVPAHRQQAAYAHALTLCHIQIHPFPSHSSSDATSISHFQRVDQLIQNAFLDGGFP